MAKHESVRSRREVVRRTLVVAEKEFLTPRMLRIVFHSDELVGFESPSPDDHIKIFLPTVDGPPAMRDFTPRAWDLDTGTLTLEFALHDSGPAATWARAARIGEALQIGGPKGSNVVPDDFDWYMLVGDSCALPSIARRLQSLREGVPVFVVALVADAEEQQSFETAADVHTVWVNQSDSEAEDTVRLRQAMDALRVPEGDGYIWIAGEAEMSRALYRYAIDERAHNAEWIKASAYWTKGSVEN